MFKWMQPRKKISKLMSMIYYALWALIFAWGATKLLIMANAAIGISSYLFFPSICDFIRDCGVEPKTIVLLLFLGLFLCTGWHIRMTRKIIPIVGFILLGIFIIICICIAWWLIQLAISCL